NPKDLFADLNKLRLSPGEGILAGSKEIVSRLDVRKATRQEFWRAHPSEDMTLLTNAYEDKENREFFVIAPDTLNPMLALGEVVPVKLVPAITRQGALLLIPAKLPVDGGAATGWHETLLVAIERAKKHWVRTSADMALGGYRIWQALGNLAEPEWPGLSLNQMLETAFKGRIIDSEDHPVFNKLLGRI